MYRALWSWVDTSLLVVRSQARLTPMALPNPSDTTTSLPVGMVDPTTVVVIVGFGVILGRAATSAYVGLVGQDPTGRWRGLTGFFVSWCQACDLHGDGAMKHIHRELVDRAVAMKSIYDLPPALRPRGRWFAGTVHDDRLLYGGFVNRWEGLSECWVTYDPQLTTGAALIATGPSASGLGNLVLLQDLNAEHDALESVRRRSPLWMQRSGTEEALFRLAGMVTPAPLRERTSLRPGALPASWGAYLDPALGIWMGPFPNLCRSMTEPTARRPAAGTVVRYLPEGHAVRLADLAQLTAH
jgi:hypothetical protein